MVVSKAEASTDLLLLPGAIAFVHRASVRGPDSPTEPPGFLFWKADLVEG